MKLDNYIKTVATEIAKGFKAASDEGINITPHLHDQIRTGSASLPYGNTGHLLIPVEIEVGLDKNGEVSGGGWGFTFGVGFKRQHRAKVSFWLELTK